jgi:hypothetical protein
MTKKWVCFLIPFLFISKVYAHEIPKDIAVRIIVSEAADQGLRGMICVGEVIRHRGSIKGFYAYRSDRIDHQPKSVWNMAAKAWDLSAGTNYTNGADHFENVHRFGQPRWARDCVETYEYKDHVFYREIYPIRPS